MRELARLSSTCLLRPGDLVPSQAGLNVVGTFNPGAVATDKGVTLLVRVAEASGETRPGYVALPRWDLIKCQLVMDWVSLTEMRPVDVRLLRSQTTGLARLSSVSHLRVVHSRDGRVVSEIGPSLLPVSIYEEYGLEDPRITRIEDTFYISYVGVSRHGVVTALATTRDFVAFERHGVIFYPENKDVVLFPERIRGEIVALHRPTPLTAFAKPEIWLASSPDGIHWGKHERLLGGGDAWDTGRIGAGTPPLRTAAGWLCIYHGNSRREGDTDIGVYSVGALLLDLENPRRILAAGGPILRPELDFERTGFVPNVLFPTGIVERGETVLVYYGAADTVSAMVELSLKDLLKAARDLPALER